MEPADPNVPYWEGPVRHAELLSLREKYAILAKVVRLTPGPERQVALREAASRWPGSLREAQLVDPRQMVLRRDAVEQGLRTEPKARRCWREVHMEAVPLWADLHELLLDHRYWRSQRMRASVGDIEGFLAILEPDRRGRWPEPATLRRLGGPRVRPRQAYLWLAHRAGLDLPALNFALFGRAGSWDRRPGDP